MVFALLDLHHLVPVGVAAVLLAGTARLVDVGRDLLVRGALAGLGSGTVAYGLRQFLRAVGGGYCCCNHAVLATVGLLVAAAGWAVLLVAIDGRVLDLA